MGRQLLAAVFGAAMGWACINEPFHCENDQQCVADGVTGQCQGNQYCTFPDEACASGQRYAQSAGGSLAGTCLPPGDAMGTEGGDDTGGGGSGSDGGPNDSTVGVDDATDGDTSRGETSRGDTTDDGPEDGPGDGPDDTTDDGIGDDDDDDDMGPVDYPPCVSIDECDDPSHVCLEPDLEEVCSPPCQSFKDCPIPPNSPTVPICTGANSSFPGVCIFPCSTNSDCPDPLDCVEDDIGLYGGEEVCAWD